MFSLCLSVSLSLCLCLSVSLSVSSFRSLCDHTTPHTPLSTAPSSSTERSTITVTPDATCWPPYAWDGWPVWSHTHRRWPPRSTLSTLRMPRTQSPRGSPRSRTLLLVFRLSKKIKRRARNHCLHPTISVHSCVSPVVWARNSVVVCVRTCVRLVVCTYVCVCMCGYSLGEGVC
jgi:hypothetical protein